MTYDLTEIKTRVKAKRKSFVISLCAICFSAIAAIIVMLAFPDITVVFIATVLIITLIFILVKIFEKYQPFLLFAKDVRGINVKEHEYVCTQRKGFSISHRYTFTRTGVRRVSNQRTKTSTKAIVYLQLPDGDIKVIEGLTNAHTDIYDDGDELLRISGTKYPIITSRSVKKHPCPICGTVNRIQDENCFSCNLKILHP